MMSEQQTQTFFGRIGNWFRRETDDRPERKPPHPQPQSENEQATDLEPRVTFLRPWAKRDAAIANLQEGFTTLTDLMGSVRDNLEKQSERQDQLLNYLSHLPKALETLPEHNRAQAETLRAIHQQMEFQNSQQKTIGDILERISESGGGQQETLEQLRERLDTLHQHDHAISDNLKSVGTAMESVSRYSESGTKVLEQMRENVNARDQELQQLLQKQSTRFTTMLAIAIFLAVGAVAAVSIFGYLLLTRPV